MRRGMLLGMLIACIAAGDESDWKNLSLLEPGDRIHVVQADKSAVTGRYRGSSERDLVMDATAGELSIPKERIVRVSRNRPARRIRNGLLLGLAGATIGAALFRFGISCHETDTGCRNAKLATIAGAAAGGGLGAATPTYGVVYRVRKLPAAAAPSASR